LISPHSVFSSVPSSSSHFSLASAISDSQSTNLFIEFSDTFDFFDLQDVRSQNFSPNSAKLSAGSHVLISSTSALNLFTNGLSDLNHSSVTISDSGIVPSYHSSFADL
jgi:hypothetical protein